MSQYASNIMMTRPYFSSSNYICKMSDFKKGEWLDKTKSEQRAYNQIANEYMDLYI